MADGALGYVVMKECFAVQIRRFSWFVLLLALGGIGAANPALAQFSPSYKFLESVRKSEAQEVTDAVSQPGATIINTQDSSTGETALHIVVARRDPTWLTFLLAKGADPNISDNHGTSPLMLATNLGFDEGVTMLVDHGARLDESNSTGETPLITAVHRHDLVLMRVLLKAGANPDRTDNSGRSARDYAAFSGPDNPMTAEIKADARANTSNSSSHGGYGPKL